MILFARVSNQDAMALQVAWYNYGRIHGSLRVTPAMEAGLTGYVWTMEEFLSWGE